MKKINSYQCGCSAGSALILAVVLTSMLAIIGTIFLMTARIDNMSTSGVTEGKELDFAVQTIIEKISHELVLDTPGVGQNQEYYDYPDVHNAWLANIEPYSDGTDYKWRQISDVTGFLNRNGIDTNDISSDPIDSPVIRKVIKEYPDIELDRYGRLDYSGGRDDCASADADGDGIADSKWFEFDNVTTGKGKTIYAAVRVIDNGGMLNVNTAYQFDPCERDDRRRVDGTRQHQIDLESLAQGTDSIEDFSEARQGTQNPTESDLEDYYRRIIARLEDPRDPCDKFRPFDILDELELRYRFCINGQAESRLENTWPRTVYGIVDDPYYRDSNYVEWTKRITTTDSADPCYVHDPDFRHYLTAYNMDRIIGAGGKRMANINSDDANDVYVAIRRALGNSVRAGKLASVAGDVNGLAAQMAANIKDYRDGQNNPYDSITIVRDDSGTPYYGFERPVICISELAYRFFKYPDDHIPPDVNVYRSYAVELYKRFGNEKFDPGEWRLVIENNSGGGTFGISSEDFNSVGGQFYVIVWQQAGGPQDANLADTVAWTDSPENGARGVDPEVPLRWPVINDEWTYDVYFGTNEADVRDANRSDPRGVLYQTNVPDFNPSRGPDVTYYWRVDDVDSSGVVQRKGDVWSFTTGNPEPTVNNLPLDTQWFDPNTNIRLERLIYGTPVVFDSKSLNFNDANAPRDGSAYSIMRRDISAGNWIKRIWDVNEANATLGTLGSRNYYYSGSDNPIVAWPKNYDFTNIGEIGQVFREDVYNYDWATNGASVREADVKVDLADPNLQKIFKYLTVADPNRDGIDNDGDGTADNIDGDNDKGTPELKIAGRININTAPAYVISKLPWVSAELAEAIVAYRDKLTSPVDYGGAMGRYNAIKTDLDVSTSFDSNDIRESLGLENIGELNLVIAGGDDESVRYYSLDGNDLVGFPDLTFGSRNRLDGVADDFEERDVIFARISDLVTVRSDVFTAYILVRIGVDGPQKRYIAILDRSNVYSASDRVKVLAMQPVPDPR